MKRVYPDYYPRFRCAADKCAHTCCVGWEIDIDAAAMNRYRRMKGQMGERLRAHIEDRGKGGGFILDERERCPLLNENGLCDLITEKGEQALCQICRDHPRFRSRLTDREEIGLGLCCEAACRLILDGKERPQLIVTDDGRSKAALTDAEKACLDARDVLFDLIWDQSLSINDVQRMILLQFCGLPAMPFSPEKWANEFLKLERMEDSWTLRLEKLRGERGHMSIDPAYDDRMLRQLLTYFVYRYAVQGWKKRRCAMNGHIAFAVLSVYMICLLSDGPDGLYESARQYSAEIEYSDVNANSLIEKLDRYAEEYQ